MMCALLSFRVVIGARLLPAREKGGRRETRLINILQFVSSTVWKSLFGKAADALERSTDNEDEYMISDSAPLTNQFISVPPDLGQLNCAAFIAGIIKGVLDGAQFVRRRIATVSAPQLTHLVRHSLHRLHECQHIR